MGYIQMRRTRSGYRYTVYDRDDHGRRVSLGTFGSPEEATAALETAEARLRADTLRLCYRTYVEDYWFSQTALAVTTRGMYLRLLRKHVLPAFGRLALRDVSARDVQGLLDSMRECGASAHLLYQVKSAMASTFRPLVDEGILDANPARRARTPKRPRSLRPLLYPPDVKAIMAGLTGPQALLVWVLIDSGLRYGEATELRPRDVDLATGAVMARRSVADVGAAFHPDGASRFLVKETKSGRERSTSVSPATAALLAEHVREHRLGPDDLLFPLALVCPPSGRPARGPVPAPPGQGRTEPNERGYSYEHGTVVAYTKGRCRCEACRGAMSEYGRSRRARRAKGRAKPARRGSANSSGHLPKDVWLRIWRRAVDRAGIGWPARTHDLRHANATWLLKNGVDLHTVKERLGHHSITVTEGYLHRIAAEDERAVAVISGLMS